MEYISREWLEKLLDRHLSNSRGAEHYAYKRIVEEINNVSMFETIVVEEDE